MRKIINSTKILFAATLFSAMLSPITNLEAQEIKGFSLSPTGNVITLEQSIKNTHSIFLTNNEDIDVLITTEIFETEKNTNIIEDPTLQVSSKWITLETEREFTLSPKETKEVIFKVNLPQDVPQILLQSTIFLNVNTFNSETDSYKFLIKMPYLINFVPVSEVSESGVEIVIDSVSNQFVFNNSNSIKFTATNSKPSNSYTKPIIYFQVLNPYSIPVYSEILNEGAKALINNESISITEDVSIPNEILKDIGTYTIEVMAVDSLSGIRNVTKKTFVNIPYYYFIALGIVVLVLIRYSKSRRNSKQK